MWLFCATLFLIRLWIPREVRPINFTFIRVFCLITTAILHFKIYLAVRRYRNQMQALQVQQEVHKGRRQSHTKCREPEKVFSFYVYLILSACYLPQNCIYLADISTGLQSHLLWHMQLYTLTLVLLNSSLNNPLIYCWNMRYIRHAVMNILRNMFKVTTDITEDQKGNRRTLNIKLFYMSPLFFNFNIITHNWRLSVMP